MRVSNFTVATARLRRAAPLIAAFAFAACGEDVDPGNPLDGSDTSQGEVGDTGPVSFTATITSPAEGQVFAQNVPVPLQLSITGVDPSRLLSIKAAVALDGSVAASDQAISFNTQGLLSREYSAGAGSHKFTVTITAPGGETQTLERNFAVNIPPDAPTLAFANPAPTTADELRVNVTLPNDPTFTGDGLTAKYRWRKVGGETNLPSSTNTLAAIHTAKGDVIEVFVKVNDGFVDGPEARAEVEILDSKPSCQGVTMSPTAARAGQDITCACAGWSDADGDSDQSTCVFTDLTSNSAIGTEGPCTLAGELVEAGMNVSCALTPHDGEEAGAVVTTPPGSAVPVLNTSPTAPVATLTPAAGNALTEFSCGLTSPGTDPDGDSLTHTTSWTVAGQAVESAATTLTASDIGAGKGEALCCRITASDGAASTASAASCVTLTNAPPTAVNVFARVRGGGAANRRSTLDCEPENPSDPDGDAVTVTYAWYVGGQVIPGATGSSLSAATIPRDSVVSCQATICDTDNACTEPIASKNSLLITNALPQIGQVDIVPNEDTSHPGQTLTCAFSGWDDPDGDAVQVTYQWVLVVNGVETVIASATTADLQVEVSMTPGSQLICRVTPMNGTTAGTTTSSAPRLIGEAIPMAPVVAVLAPAGANGPLTCQTTAAAQFIPQGAVWTWKWSRNDVTLNVPSSTTLQVGQVNDCDLVKCWVEIRATGLSLDSNKGSSLMPLGTDCEDGNPCTEATCFNGGGCNQVAVDGGSCDDGNACTENEVCQAGTCVGTLDVCTEDRLSLAATNTPPVVLRAHPDGGYLAVYGGLMRRTDKYGTRIDEQTDGNSSHGGAIAPSGRVARYRYQGATGNCTPQTNYQCFYYTVRVFNADLVTYSDLPVDVYCGCGATLPSAGTTLPMGEDAFAVFVQRGAAIELQLIDAALNRTSFGAIVGPIYTGTAGQDLGWHVAKVPDGTDAFMVAWVTSDRKSVLALRYSALGAAEYAQPVTVATTTSTFDAVAIAPMVNGRFVVAYQGAGLDGNAQGIMARRFDDAGNALGAAFQVNEVATGDQALGGVAAFSNLRFAIAYRDGSVAGGRYLARAFSAAGEGGTPIVLNGATVASAVVPSIAAMSDDDFVTGWKDSAGVLWTRRYRFDGTYSQGAAEFRANDASANQQETPVAAGAPNGNVIIAYASQVFTAGNFATEIMARVFDEDGLEVSREHIVNGTMAYAQTQPAVAASADGFVIAWNSEEQDGEADGIFARRYDAGGVVMGTGDIAVTTTTAGYQRQPAVAMATNGTWVAAWNAQSSVAGSTSDVVARIFPATGAPTAEVVLNSTLSNVQERPALAMVPFTTDFVAVWQSRNQDGDGLGIFARKFGADGAAKTPEYPVNSRTAGDQRNATVAISQTNQVAVCWESVGQVTAGKTAVVCQYLRTSDLLPSGAEFVPFSYADEQSAPTARFQANGHLAVAYQTLGLDSQSYAIQLVRVTNQGVRTGRRFTMNRTWLDSQSRPFVVPQDDRLFVGWQSNLQDGSLGGIFFRILPQP